MPCLWAEQRGITPVIVNGVPAPGIQINMTTQRAT